MMKINIVGAGPAGLFFAYLMKKDFPAHRVIVFEQNPVDATFGFGVVLSERALRFLSVGDGQLVDRLSQRMEQWSDQHLVHRGERVVIDGSSYAAIERLSLLQELGSACAEVGVEVHFSHRIDAIDDLSDCDILVGSDGANSVVRDQFADALGTRVTDLRNYFAWYGVDCAYPAHTLTFKSDGGGVFCGHHYRYTPTRSTFVAEVDSDTWQRSGMYAMSNDERRRLFEDLFRDTLDGRELLTNRSAWRRWRLVTNDRWSFRNVVLLGDALRTAHPSIGSGTRLAMEDAISLWRAFTDHSENIGAAFAAYERERRPIRNRMNEAADRSIDWYERLPEKMALSAYAFAYDYALRTGIVTARRLAAESPRFYSGYAEEIARLASASPSKNPSAAV
jgi:2-polyprenyl-6-methoxyphenol hydroxylase-like FAD-dependent oxidoreductase